MVLFIVISVVWSNCVHGLSLPWQGISAGGNEEELNHKLMIKKFYTKPEVMLALLFQQHVRNKEV